MARGTADRLGDRPFPLLRRHGQPAIEPVGESAPPPFCGSARRSFAGTLGTRIYQTAARDPEANGVIERANGFLATSFMPGRSFTSPADYNTELTDWLPTANSRVLRRTGQDPSYPRRSLCPAQWQSLGSVPNAAATCHTADW
jgi:hypothetical protein